MGFLSMFRVPLTLLMLAAFAMPAPAQDVIRAEVLARGDSVEHISAEAASDEFWGVPADDNHKWFISVVTMNGCAPCARLTADFATNPALAPFVNSRDHKQSWAHYNKYLNTDESQKYRWEKIKLTAFPTIIVQPPLNKQYGDPSTVVFQQTGYDGNAKALAGKIAAAIKAYVVKRQGFKDVGLDPPWNPAPRVEPPAVDPNPHPAPTPFLPPVVDIPNIPPVDVAPPKPETPKDVESPCPEAIVITDAENGLTDKDSDRVNNVISALRAQRGKNLRVRLMDWREAKDRYPVQRDEVPVIFVTHDGQIADKISGRLLPFLGDDPAPKEVTLSDVPWASIVALLTTGFSIPAAAALGIFAFRFIRSRRKAAGKELLIDDATMATVENLLELAQTWLANKSPKPPA